jgi:hypothetical protein
MTKPLRREGLLVAVPVRWIVPRTVGSVAERPAEHVVLAFRAVDAAPARIAATEPSEVEEPTVPGGFEPAAAAAADDGRAVPGANGVVGGGLVVSRVDHCHPSSSLAGGASAPEAGRDGCGPVAMRRDGLRRPRTLLTARSRARLPDRAPTRLGDAAVKGIRILGTNRSTIRPADDVAVWARASTAVTEN